MQKRSLRLALVLFLTTAVALSPGAAFLDWGSEAGTGGAVQAGNDTGYLRASRAIPSPDVQVYIDGNHLHLADPPAIYQGRALVPMRHFFEALGAHVSWDGVNRIARGSRGGIEVLIPIWSSQPTVNGETVTIDVAAQIWNDRTYIPLRFVGEALGDDVAWDGANRQIFITTQDGEPTRPPDDPQPLGSETVSPSDDDQTVTFGDVKVTIPGGVLDQAQEVSVSYLGSGREPPDADMEEMTLWEVQIGNMREFRHPVAIEFPYDPAAVPAGEDPEGLFTGLRWDSGQNQWVELPAGVDTRSQTVTVTTTGLSEVGWARLRRAHYVEDARFIVYFREDHQPTVYDEQGQLMTPEEYARLVLGYLNDAHHALVDPRLDHSFRDPRDNVFAGQQVRVWTGAFDESQYNDRTGTISITAYQDAMLENRLPVPGSGMEGARHDAAHEYFHAIQNSYMTWTSMRGRYWWIEATADYAAGGAVGTGLLRGLDQGYFQNPIYYSGKEMQMYETANFVKFLVEEKGVDFQHLWETSAGGYQVFDNLKRYISNHTDGTFTSVYRDFARQAFFSSAGPATESLNDMGQQSAMALTDSKLEHTFTLGRDGTAGLWSISPEIPQDEDQERTLQVTLESSKPAQSSVDIFVLSDNQRVSGTPQPTAELLHKEYPESVQVKEGETLYILATNTGSGSENIEVSVQGQDAQVSIVGANFTHSTDAPGEGYRDYHHQFEAEAEPNDSYRFEWDFGDGSNVVPDLPGAGESSQLPHSYYLPPQAFVANYDVTVKLYDLDGNLLAEDTQTVSTGPLVDYDPE